MRELRKIMQEPDLRDRRNLRAGSGAAGTLDCADGRVRAADFPGRCARACWLQRPGVRIVDDVPHNHFPMPREASGQGDVLIGRIRQDPSDPSGRSLALLVAGDQLLKGAALNAVQIAERLVA